MVYLTIFACYGILWINNKFIFANVSGDTNEQYSYNRMKQKEMPSKKVEGRVAKIKPQRKIICIQKMIL